jgi:hypothetical protein
MINGLQAYDSSSQHSCSKACITRSSRNSMARRQAVPSNG